MATYKLIQDVEAEDHILGPLTLRQFIFALLGAFCWYLSFIAFVKHVYPALIITVPPALFFTFFAIPFGRDQPTEVWALAKLHYWFKPRRRIWDQSGVKELVTITVPKKVERVLTKGYSESEVQSRLKGLANTLDSRGWAVKNVNSGSDRLLDIGNAPQEVPNYEVQPSDDILDEASNPVAQQFQSMITKSSKDQRQRIIKVMDEIRTSQPAKTWFTKPASGAGTDTARPSAYSHLRTLRPAEPAQIHTQAQPARPATQPVAKSKAPSGVPAPDPAIISLANNNDLNVSTLARQAYKAKNGDEPPQNEVVVSLH